MITNQYTYNGDGQRVQVIDSQGTKKQIWDGENILLETDGADATQVVYTHEPAGYGNLVSQRRSSTTSYFLFDALGSTRKLTSSAGSVTDSYDFRAFGETVASTGTTTNVFRWVGQLGYYFDLDRLGYYLRRRPYSPKLARLLSRDPIGFDGSKWNLFEYVLSRPTEIVDPTGLGCWTDCMGDMHDRYWEHTNNCFLAIGIGGAVVAEGCLLKCIGTGPGYPACVGACFSALGIGGTVGAACCMAYYQTKMTGGGIGCSIGCWWD